jgi:hypothetical protein
MKAARAAFIRLLGKIEEHLRTTDQSERLNELAVFRSLAEHGDERLAAEAMGKLVVLAQGHGYDAELAPYAEEARRWCEGEGVSPIQRQRQGAAQSGD